MNRKRDVFIVGKDRPLLCLLFCLLFLPTVCAQNTPAGKRGDTTDSTRTVFSEIIYFSQGKGDWIEQSEYKKTGRLLRWALSDTVTPITITGWTDPTGTQAFNEQLSLRRARTVRNYLISKGVAAGRIRIEGRGVDTRAENADEARRAEIAAVVYLTVKSVAAEKQETREDVRQQEQQHHQATAPARKETRPEPEQTDRLLQADESVPAASQTSSRYFAVKTNLAAWAGTIMNVAADVQVGRHWSVELPVLWCRGM